MKLATIVEGAGEVEAVPVLLRRFAALAGVSVEIERPIRIPKGKIVKEVELRRAVRLASLRGEAILVLLDADDDCAVKCARTLRDWATEERSDRAIAVVVAVREFEAWFVAAAASLAAAGKLKPGSAPASEPEAIRDAKGWLSGAMGRRYAETIDQPSFAALFDLDAARACRSFTKLECDVRSLLTGS